MPTHKSLQPVRGVEQTRRGWPIQTRGMPLLPHRAREQGELKRAGIIIRFQHEVVLVRQEAHKRHHITYLSTIPSKRTAEEDKLQRVR